MSAEKVLVPFPAACECTINSVINSNSPFYDILDTFPHIVYLPFYPTLPHYIIKCF